MIIASSARGTSGFALVVVAIAMAAATPVRAQSDRPARALVAGERVERSLQLGDTQTYTVDLPARQHARVTADQDGIDLILSIDAPDGSRLIDVDLQPYYAYGRETIAFVASTAGAYRVMVREAQPRRPADTAPRLPIILAPADAASLGTSGRYAIRVHDFRRAGPNDAERAAIERLLLDADRVRRLGTRANVIDARRPTAASKA